MTDTPPRTHRMKRSMMNVMEILDTIEELHEELMRDDEGYLIDVTVLEKSLTPKDLRHILFSIKDMYLGMSDTSIVAD